MSAAIKLLDKYRATCYPPQDLQVAKNLRVSHPAVSNWRRGRAHPDAESVEKMANAIGEPVGPWLAQIEAERARTPAGRQVWLRLAATLGTALAAALTVYDLFHPEHGALVQAVLLGICINQRTRRPRPC